MQKSVSIAFLSSLLFLLFASCDTEDPFEITPPDFSTVPEPYNTDTLEAVTLEEGIRYYQLEEGEGPFYLTAKDFPFVYLTLRTEEGEIVYSTFANGNEVYDELNMPSADGTNPALHQNIFQATVIRVAYTPGLKKALLGMKEGEKRTIVVSPEHGFQTIPQNNVNIPYRENTLVYDVHLVQIRP